LIVMALVIVVLDGLAAPGRSSAVAAAGLGLSS
jgi:hypothetical protein